MPTLSHTPNNQEQLLLEYLNLLRMDPGSEFDRLIADPVTGTAVQTDITSALNFFGVSVASFRSQMNAYIAVAPLAWNGALAQAAEAHTLLMAAQDEQSHQLPGEPDLATRITSAGYTNWTSLGENVFAYARDPLYGHAGFVIDWGYDQEDFQNGNLLLNWKTLGDGIQDPAGHRITMLNANMTEVGMAMLAENNPATDVGPFLITQNFGARAGYQAQLIGVVLNDEDRDAFYDIGEGLGGVTVTATGASGTFTTTSWSSGGYQMALPAGSYSVAFSGGGMGGTAVYNVTIGNANVKLDAFSQDVFSNQRLLGNKGQQDFLNGGLGNDTLYGDGYHLAYDLNEARAIYRLYQATLDRAPDIAGFADWTERLVNGSRSLQEIAAGFVGSIEFQRVYGALNDRDFVELLYQNVLNRASDPAGLQGWTGLLGSGARSREQVLTGFSESNEFRQATNGAANAFIQGRDAAFWQDDIYRLYQATLDRAPDAAGFKNWLSYMDSGKSFLTAVAGFVNSREFQNNYGALSDRDFVELLYNNVLDRAPDAGGLSHWTNALAGGMSRAHVVQGFSQSREFIAATAPEIKAWIRAQGPDDYLAGGAGINDLWGGAGADVFVFDNTDAGTHRTHDFEAWDYLDFRAFGFVDAADIRANMTQQGTNVVFSNQGTTVTLANTLLGNIDNDNLLF